MKEAYRFKNPPAYPHLAERIHKRGFRVRAFLWSLAGYKEVVSGLLHDLEQTVQEGEITQELYGAGTRQEHGIYTVRMDETAATQLVEAAEKYLANPDGFTNFAEAMDPYVESLICGTASTDYYRLITPISR